MGSQRITGYLNGDDVEALIHCINIALEYRQRFKKDIFIDILCYRKYGHNEGDEPRFTQPLLYQLHTWLSKISANIEQGMVMIHI